MATHRRNLAAASMDPTLKRQHQPVSSTTHPHPDPATATIRSISRRFSNLYSNHKRLSAHHRHLDSACPALTKSKSEHGTTLQKSHKDPDFTIKKSGGDEIKKASEEEVKKRPSVSVSLEMGEGRRRSFSSSQTELADFFSCNTVKVISVDMPPFMQIHAVGCARKVYDSLEKFTSKSLAFSLKKEFDGVYGPAWHCIVGKSFGSFVTHSVGGFIYFSMDPKLYVLLFKTTVQRAD